MLKKILYTAFLILASVVTFAQAPSYPAKTYLGFNAGYGFSGVTFQPASDQSTYNGSYTGGITFKHRNEKYFALQAELNYTHRGYNRPLDEKTTYKRTYNSIMLPAMAQIIVSYKRFSVITNLGCYASYMLNSETETTQNGVTQKSSYEFFLKRDTRYEFGALAGAGLSIDANPILIQVESRFYYGLTNLYDPDYTNNRPYGSRQFQLQFSAALLYNLGSLFGSDPKLTKK